MSRIEFYKNNLKRSISDKEASILVIAGGKLDKQVYLDLGYKNVIISNIDSRMNANEYLPYTWSFQNAENLTYQDNFFDYTVVHAALHHCKSPHKALLEMYRVAKKGIIAFESKESFLMKLGLKLNLIYQYELPAVRFNDMKYGGLQNTEIPNFVYRWTENEIEKLVNCYAPFSRHKIRYFYGFSIPYYKTNFFMKNLLIKLLKFLFKIIPRKQGNLFGFFIAKPNYEKDTFPWLIYKNNKLELNKQWLKNNWVIKKF